VLVGLIQSQKITSNRTDLKSRFQIKRFYLIPNTGSSSSSSSSAASALFKGPIFRDTRVDYTLDALHVAKGTSLKHRRQTCS